MAKLQCQMINGNEQKLLEEGRVLEQAIKSVANKGSERVEVERVNASVWRPTICNETPNKLKEKDRERELKGIEKRG